ncbi:HNH endonuclease, partial [bacterium]|nr:HNH endonuclease [bacterium]
NQLLVAMGIKEIASLPVPIFEREIKRDIQHVYPDPVDVAFSKKLATDAIPIHISDLKGGLNGLLEDADGRKVCAYIRDQKSAIFFRGQQAVSEYRYHLCNCRTLRTMKDLGREHRFLKTQRTDGLFVAHDLTVEPYRTEENVKMELCQNCKAILQEKEIYFSPFNLNRYFAENDSYTPKTIRRIKTVSSVQTYTPDHRERARAYKVAAKYKCQLCGVNCIAMANQELLHFHHKDGDPSNNQNSNAMVLCVDCHSKQPMHGHMLRNPNFKSQVQRIKRLRSSQGLLTVTP